MLVNWQEWLEWLTTGTPGFIGYWLILGLIVVLELILPGPRQRTPAGPRLTTNLSLGVIAAALNSLPPASELAMAQWIQAKDWGLLNLTVWPLWLHVLATFLAYDLLGYALHRASHVWHPLWRLHQVHHSDADIDLSTLFRIHPLSVPVLLGLDFLAIATLGLHPLGILLHGAAKLITMGLGHAHVAPRPGLSRAVAVVFVTPDFHRRHHSAWQPETDSNYGEVLSIWDRLFASRAPSAADVARFGLGDTYDGDAASLKGQLRLPFIAQ